MAKLLTFLAHIATSRINPLQPGPPREHADWFLRSIRWLLVALPLRDAISVPQPLAPGLGHNSLAHNQLRDPLILA